MKQYRTSPEVKEQIINRIKNEGVTVAQAAKEHGLHDSTIYGWLGAKTESTAPVLEIAKLRRENDELLRLVGLMTLKLSESQKKK
jgi:transposase-like protein